MKVAQGPEFDKDRDFGENKSETSKNSVDQIFTGENKKAEFLEVRCFLSGIFPGLWVNFWFCYHTYLTKNLGLFIFEVFTGLRLYSPTFVQKVMIMSKVLSVYWFY